MKDDLDKLTPLQAYTKGFIEGACIKDGYKLSILGYEMSELIKIIVEWESRQPDILYSFVRDNKSLRVEQWPEGHVVWANGEIIWKSWK